MARILKYNILNCGLDGWVFCGFCRNFKRKGFCLSTYETTEDTQIQCAGFCLSEKAKEQKQIALEKQKEAERIKQPELFYKWEME